MDIQVKEENGQLICLKHNKRIMLFIMDKKIPFKDTLICSECIQEKQTISNNIIGIAQVLKMINEKENLANDQQQMLEALQQLSNTFFEYKNKVIEQIETSMMIINQWMKDIQSFRSTTKSLIQNLQLLNQQEDKLIENVNKSHLIKLLNQFKKLFVKNELISCNKEIQLLVNKIYSKPDPLINEALLKDEQNEVKTGSWVFDCT